ncbi:MAG: hypothetical protein ACYSW3_00350 [Planctomycetota bacterium]
MKKKLSSTVPKSYHKLQEDGKLDLYIHDERLDGLREMARFLGVSDRHFHAKILPKMKDAGIIFRRRTGYDQCTRTRIKAKYFTYKRLIIAFLMKYKTPI